MNEELSLFLKEASVILRRLDTLLPPEQQEPDWRAIAYRWQKVGTSGVLISLPHPNTFSLTRLASVDKQMKRLVKNTEQFLSGKTANNVLLSGARGTGKSSLVKALLHEYHQQGLRLIEVDKTDLITLPSLLKILSTRKERYIVFCDDLSFDFGDDSYKALKTALDGGLSLRCENVLVYATSNRRHLMPEMMSDNYAPQGDNGEVHAQEAVEEKVSLSDRFGLWLSFYPFDQKAYLAAVENWLMSFELEMDETTRQAALNWSLTRGSRSGRVAWQFVCDWAGREANERVID